jgi:DNA polymerase-3 subunit gamma/tau
MSYKILSLKWRPQKFSEIIGQDHISIALSNAIKLDRVAHAFIFSGPRGVGKTTTARVLAKTLNNVNQLSDSLDIIEMDAASNRGIDEIRLLRENVQYAPSEGKYKIYIIDEAHMLTKEAFNALLKTLEEPPAHVVFILATTELYKMPETIISRTQRYDFKRLTIHDIIKQMKFILKEENISYDLDSLDKIAIKADGSMRDALSILDQIICICNNDITVDKVTSILGIVSEENFFTILSSIGNRKSKEILECFNGILLSGVSIQNFMDGFSTFINKCMISQAMPDNEQYKEFFVLFTGKNIQLTELDLLRISELLLTFQSSLKSLQQPRISIESLLVKLSYLDKAIDISKFIEINKFENIEDAKYKNSSTESVVVAKKTISKEKDSKSINKEKNIDSDIIITKDSISKTDNKHIDINIEKSLNDDKESKKELPSDNQSKNLEINKKDVISSGDNKLKDSNIKKIQNDEKKTSINILSKKFIYDNWNNLLSSLNKANIVHSLEKIKIKELSESKISIVALNIGEFMYKNLLNEITLINDNINKYFNVNLILDLSYEKKKVDKIKPLKKNSNQDKEHPLFMNAMNKFEGEIIK